MFGYTPDVSSTAMLAMSSGISPTDPRLQPFLKSVREENIRLHVNVLMSNGLPEAQAKAEAERAAGDRMQYFGQAVVKYFASLSGQQPTAPNYEATLALLSLHAQQQQQQLQQQQQQQVVQQVSQVVQPASPQAPKKASAVLNLGPLQKLIQGNTPGPSKPTTAPATVPAIFSSRFDVPAVLEEQQLEKALQQWTYRVYSSHQLPPPGVDGKLWRTKLFEFVNNQTAQARASLRSSDPKYQSVCSWLSVCRIPTPEEIMGRVPFVSVPNIPPPPPEHSGLSPVSSSSSTRKRKIANKRSLESEDSSSSSMSSSSTWSSNRATRRAKVRRVSTVEVRAGKKVTRQKKEAAVRKGFDFPNISARFVPTDEMLKRDSRAKRFSAANDGANESGTGNLLTWQEKLALLTSVKQVVGLSQALEKPYLRLCGPPDPNLVRPERVLRESFRLCMKKWLREKNYRFIEEQFRSIRQDLTVQGIKNLFTVEVYETNARVALQNGDLGQFNQCQTQLRELHRVLEVADQSKTEFLCYRIIYLSLTNMRHDFLKLSGELEEHQRRQPEIVYAFKFRKALIEGNFHRLFRMVENGPFLVKHLVAIFMGRMRMAYIVLISRSHYTVSANFVRKELVFNSDLECRKFLIDNRVVWAKADVIDCRKSASFFEASPLLQTTKMKAFG